jgi:hypothetical protein
LWGEKENERKVFSKKQTTESFYWSDKIRIRNTFNRTSWLWLHLDISTLLPVISSTRLSFFSFFVCLLLKMKDLSNVQHVMDYLIGKRDFKPTFLLFFF